MRAWWPWRSRVGHEDAAAFVDGGLPPPKRDAFAYHLALCSQCRTSVEEHRLTKALLGALPPVALPRSFILTPQRAATPRPIRPVRAPLWRDLAGARLAVAVSTLTAAAMLGAVLVDFRDGAGVQSSDGGGVNAAQAVAQFDTDPAPDAPPQPVATSLELIDSAPAPQPAPAPPSSTAPAAESLPDETDLPVAAAPEEADPPPVAELAPLAVPGGGGESERDAPPPDQSTETVDAEGTVLVAAAEPEQSLPPSEAPDAQAGSPEPEDSALDPDAAADGQDVTEPEDAAEAADAADAPADGAPPETDGGASVAQEFEPAAQAGADAAPSETAEPPTPAGDAEDLSTVTSTSDAENATDASTSDAPTPEPGAAASTEREPQDTAVAAPDEIEAVEEVVAAAGPGAFDEAADAGDIVPALDAAPVAPPSDETASPASGVDAALPEDATSAEAPPAEVQPQAEGRPSAVSLEPQGTAQDRAPLARSAGAESDRPWLLPLEIALGVITVLALALALWLHRRALPG